MLGAVYTINRGHHRRGLLSGIRQRLFGPLRVNLVFRERSYRLGDTLHLTVLLSSRRDLEVVEGRIDLVSEERYAKSYALMVPDYRAAKAAAGTVSPSTGTPLPSVMVPKREVEQRVERFVHSSVVFATDARLRRGFASRYSAKLDIQPDPPPHAGIGAARWRLMATVRLSQGRDVTHECPVSLSLG